tara:strand:- start:4275 stop:4520 length:246 start_codon:yes stop_codon:yes gene_type:complete
MEILGLIIGMVVVAFISLRVGKILPQEMALVPLLIMLILDGMLVYGFKEFVQMENKQIAFAIMGATMVKVLFLVLTLPKGK